MNYLFDDQSAGAAGDGHGRGEVHAAQRRQMDHHYHHGQH